MAALWCPHGCWLGMCALLVAVERAWCWRRNPRPRRAHMHGSRARVHTYTDMYRGARARVHMHSSSACTARVQCAVCTCAPCAPCAPCARVHRVHRVCTVCTACAPCAPCAPWRTTATLEVVVARKGAPGPLAPWGPWGGHGRARAARAPSAMRMVSLRAAHGLSQSRQRRGAGASFRHLPRGVGCRVPPRGVAKQRGGPVAIGYTHM